MKEHDLASTNRGRTVNFIVAPALAEPRRKHDLVRPPAIICCRRQPAFRRKQEPSLERRRICQCSKTVADRDRRQQTAGVICPPEIDPAIKVPTPNAGTTPVIPPTGQPGWRSDRSAKVMLVRVSARRASAITRSRNAVGSIRPPRARSIIRVAMISRPFSSPA